MRGFIIFTVLIIYTIANNYNNLDIYHILLITELLLY